VTENTAPASKNFLELGAIPSVPQISRNAVEDLRVVKRPYYASEQVTHFYVSESEKIILNRPNIVAVVATIAENTDQKQGNVVGARKRGLGKCSQIMTLDKRIVKRYS